MIIGSGYDMSVGGAQGTGYQGSAYNPAYATRGVSLELWLSWDKSTQDNWLEDYNRTAEQQNYSTDSDYAKVYVIKEGVDEYIIDPVVHTTQTVYEDVKGAVSYGFDTATLVGIGALILLMGR